MSVNVDIIVLINVLSAVVAIQLNNTRAFTEIEQSNCRFLKPFYFIFSNHSETFGTIYCPLSYDHFHYPFDQLRKTFCHIDNFIRVMNVADYLPFLPLLVWIKTKHEITRIAIFRKRKPFFIKLFFYKLNLQ